MPTRPREPQSGRNPDFDPNKGWPGPRYMGLPYPVAPAHPAHRHGVRLYVSASLAKHIYTGTEDEPQAGILIYTAAPDSEGTLGGGFVALAETGTLNRLIRDALKDARHCSSDPLCAERLPQDSEDFLHGAGAACHVCLFVSETTCERGNRFLDRRLLVDIDEYEHIMLTPEGL